MVHSCNLDIELLVKPDTNLYTDVDSHILSLHWLKTIQKCFEIKSTQIIAFEELFTLFILVSLMNKAAQNENLYLKENPENCVQSRSTHS